jgi:hypothetical protein
MATQGNEVPAARPLRTQWDGVRTCPKLYLQWRWIIKRKRRVKCVQDLWYILYWHKIWRNVGVRAIRSVILFLKLYGCLYCRRNSLDIKQLMKAATHRQTLRTDTETVLVKIQIPISTKCDSLIRVLWNREQISLLSSYFYCPSNNFYTNWQVSMEFRMGISYQGLTHIFPFSFPTVNSINMATVRNSNVGAMLAPPNVRSWNVVRL